MTDGMSDRRKMWLDSLPKRASSAALLLENEAGELLIVKANYKPYWSLPGGVIDPGETPKEAAIRETFEEVGLQINPDAVQFVMVVNRVSTITQTYQFVFKAKLQTEIMNSIVLQASEIDEYALISRTQVRSQNKPYAKVIEYWADGVTGYIEHVFDNG